MQIGVNCPSSSALTCEIKHESKSKMADLKTDSADRSKRRYARVSNQQRDYFLELVHDKQTKLKKAAQLADIGYENAKAINRIYRKEGRNHRKQFKDFVKTDQLLKNKDSDTKQNESQEETKEITFKSHYHHKSLNFNSVQKYIIKKSSF